MPRPTLFDHPKFARLVFLLKMPEPHVLGHLEFLWRVGYSSGNPEFRDATDVELAAKWTGEPGVFSKALVDVRFLDKRGRRLYIHDLHENAPEYVRARHRMHKWRQENNRNKGATVRDGDVTVTQPLRNGYPSPAPAPAPAPLVRESPYGDSPAAAGKAEPKPAVASSAEPEKTPEPSNAAAASEPPPPAADPAEPDSRPEPEPAARGGTREPEPGGSSRTADDPVAAAVPKGRRRKNPAASPNHRAGVDAFCERWKARYGAKYPFLGARDGETVKWMLREVGDDLPRLVGIFDSYLGDDDPFFVKDRHSLGLLKSQWRKFIVPAGPLRREGEPSFFDLGPRVVPADDVIDRLGSNSNHGTRP